MNTKIVIEFNASNGTVSLSNDTGIKTVAKIKNNVVSLNTKNKEIALKVGLFIQHLGIDIKRLVEIT